MSRFLRLSRSTPAHPFLFTTVYEFDTWYMWSYGPINNRWKGLNEPDHVTNPIVGPKFRLLGYRFR
ncbi:hypothetical protein HanPSC8_Chr17g0770421 [Helianthus annuus]|nr:hypothetical protein HanPSC8_Chr17g0770421 [Helianthus annuus]